MMYGCGVPGINIYLIYPILLFLIISMVVVGRLRWLRTNAICAI